MNKRNILKKAAGWTVYIAILALAILFIPKGLSFALETPYPMAAITSGSMWPTLREGDLVFIKGIDGKEDIKVGDIIIFENTQGFTIHRVVKMGDEQLVTKGDANNSSDPLIHYSEVIGKTLNFNDKPFRIPRLGLVSILLNKGEI